MEEFRMGQKKVGYLLGFLLALTLAFGLLPGLITTAEAAEIGDFWLVGDTIRGLFCDYVYDDDEFPGEGNSYEHDQIICKVPEPFLWKKEADEDDQEGFSWGWMFMGVFHTGYEDFDIAHKPPIKGTGVDLVLYRKPADKTWEDRPDGIKVISGDGTQGAPFQFGLVYILPYLDWNGTEVVEKNRREACIEYTSITPDTTILEDGKWYAVGAGKNISVNDMIKVNGTVHLVLCDGATLNAQQGIDVDGNGHLFLHGQSGRTGKLIANGGHSAPGIHVGSGGALTVTGCVVDATGRGQSAGIGGAFQGNCGTVTVNAGSVTARGGNFGAGIGGGYQGGGGTITVHSGTVTATGGNDAAGIGGGGSDGRNLVGGGSGGTVTVHGGRVLAVG